MKCQVCNQETLLPFRCPFCGGQFCSAHRLPENHACPRIDFARSQRQEQVMTPQAYNSYQYTYNMTQPKRERDITTQSKRNKTPSSCSCTYRWHRFFYRIVRKIFGRFQFHVDLGFDGYFRHHTSSLYVDA